MTESKYDLIATPRIEVRQADNGGPTTLAGYAAVFFVEGDSGTEYRLFYEGREVVERFERGAFDRILRDGNPDGRDVVAVPDHNVRNSKEYLGRTDAGTLRLSVDSVGLRYEVDLPETTAARDMVAQIRRGDIRGSSLGFLPHNPGGSRIERRDDGPALRWVSDVGYLRDLGPTGREAYRATTVSLRADFEEMDAESAAKAALANQRRARERDLLIDRLGHPS